MSTETSISTIKFLLIEDDWRLRDSLLHGLAKDPKLQCVAATDNGQQALEHLRTEAIDLIIMDYALNDHNLWGVELTREIHKEFPEKKVMFWSAHIREIDLEQAKEAGASGYVPKDKSDQYVMDAIDRIMRGEHVWANNQSEVPGINGENRKLTPTEVKIMELLAEGKSNTQIAYSRLEIEYRKMIEDYGNDYVITNYGSQSDFISVERLKASTRNVEKHCENIREKLNIRNRIDLFRRALDEYGKLENRRTLIISEIEIKVLMLLHESKKDAEIAELLQIKESEVARIRKKFNFGK